MKNQAVLFRSVDRRGTAAEAGAPPRIGRLVHGEGRELLVEYGQEGPMPTRLVAALDRRELLRPENARREVLLVFERGDPERPIIVDMMEREMDLPVSVSAAEVAPREKPEAFIDGKRVVIEGREEVVLRCGKGYIMIRADGKIVVKGTHLLSRSTGVNKIKGGAVRIN